MGTRNFCSLQYPIILIGNICRELSVKLAIKSENFYLQSIFQVQ